MENKKRYTVLFLIATSLIVFVVSFLYFQQSMNDKAARENTVSNIQKLATADPDFQMGIQAMDNGGEIADIIPLFRASLARQAGTQYEVFPKFLLASNLGWAASPITNDDPQLSKSLRESISLFKEIVASQSYQPSRKASAVQAMEQLLSTSRSADVRALLIETEPYKSFDTDGTLRTLQKNMLSYSETLYPIAGVETKLASLYAMDMAEYARDSMPDTTSKSKIESQKNTVEKLIAQAIESQKNTVPYSIYMNDIPRTLLFKAIAARYYYEATKETPFGDVEMLYKESLASAEKMSPARVPGFHLYYYASYLSTLNDPTRHDKIKSLLKENYSQENYFEKAKKGLFANERGNALGEKQNIIKLAKIDPDFKETLFKLGWEESDFQ